MFDTCFDSPRSEIPRSDRQVLWSVRIVAGALTMMAGWAGAQLPGAPVLQNAWAMPGMAAAFNFGGGSSGSVYAAAGSWTSASARFQLSGGLGTYSQSGTGASWAYGMRAAMPMAGSSANFGFGAFAGIGGSAKQTTDTTGADTVAATTRIPVGVAIGWRQAVGSRGFSLYATPSYVWSSGGGRTSGLIRAGLGADVGITNSIGITGGIELGQTKTGTSGPSGTVYGLGISYVFGRR